MEQAGDPLFALPCSLRSVLGPAHRGLTGIERARGIEFFFRADRGRVCSARALHSTVEQLPPFLRTSIGSVAIVWSGLATIPSATSGGAGASVPPWIRRKWCCISSKTRRPFLAAISVSRTWVPLPVSSGVGQLRRAQPRAGSILHREHDLEEARGSDLAPDATRRQLFERKVLKAYELSAPDTASRGSWPSPTRAAMMSVFTKKPTISISDLVRPGRWAFRRRCRSDRVTVQGVERRQSVMNKSPPSATDFFSSIARGSQQRRSSLAHHRRPGRSVEARGPGRP